MCLSGLTPSTPSCRLSSRKEPRANSTLPVQPKSLKPFSSNYTILFVLNHVILGFEFEIYLIHTDQLN